eukprot:1151517-Pelagomonas_calceolata.AAC.1
MAALVRGLGPALGGIMWAASLSFKHAGQQAFPFTLVALVAIAAHPRESSGQPYTMGHRPIPFPFLSMRDLNKRGSMLLKFYGACNSDPVVDVGRVSSACAVLLFLSARNGRRPQSLKNSRTSLPVPDMPFKELLCLWMAILKTKPSGPKTQPESGWSQILQTH